MERKVELLMPAGSPETLRVAIDYGADAVYLGGKSFGLRAKAGNFTIEEMKEGIAYAHARNAKVYVTVNIFAHNYDLDGLRTYFEEIRNLDIDAILVADPGVFMLAREVMPDMELHISTQANNTNYMTFNYWHKQGASRVVCARELSLAEIKEIREHTDPNLEIEAFMHGAMCISYSGRCLLSSYFTGRDANHGACTHPCRWKYSIVEEKRPGEYLPVEEDDRGTYIFNSKDLCMIEHIPEMIDAGIYSFKVEGRMKTALYVAAAARAYRQAIDDYLTSEELYRSRMAYYKEEIEACTFRQFTTGFYFEKPTHETQIYDSNTYVKNYTYLGTVEAVTDAEEPEKARIVFSQKNKFSVGDTISVMLFCGRNRNCRVISIQDEEQTEMPSAPHPKQKLFVQLADVDSPEEHPAQYIQPGMIIRTKHCEA